MRTATLTLGYNPFTRNEAGHNNTARFVRNVLLFTAAPFVGLAYVLAFPLVGLGMLAWMALRPARAAA